MKMNYIFKLMLLIVSVNLYSCKDNGEIANQEYLNGVENLIAKSNNSGVQLNWENPDGHKYDKVEISYMVDSEKVILMETILEKYSSLNISLPNAQVYKFTVRALSSISSQFSEEQSVKGRKLVEQDPSDELSDMLNSVEMYGGDGGARIIWKNPKDIHAIIEVKYDGNSIEIDANKLLREYTIPQLELNRNYDFSVSIKHGDVLTDAKVFTVKPALGFKRLNNDGWSILASSEEIESENAAVNNLLDGSNLTYWRTKVSGTAAKYPHYIIIDLKRERKIQGLSLSRKFGDDDYSSWDNNISLSTDGVTYPNKYIYFNASKDPNLIFQVEFNRTVEGEQMYLLPNVQTARYIKIDMVRGSKTYAVFSNLNIYGE